MAGAIRMLGVSWSLIAAQLTPNRTISDSRAKIGRHAYEIRMFTPFPLGLGNKRSILSQAPKGLISANTIVPAFCLEFLNFRCASPAAGIRLPQQVQVS